MPLARLLRDKLAVDGIEYRDRDSIREVPGSKWKDGVWTVPLSWATLTVLKSIFGDRLETSDEVRVWAWREYEDRIKPTLAARELALLREGDTDGDPRLYPLQRTGVSFLRASGGAILSDHMGMGKTISAMTTIEEGGLYPALIVCPNSVKRVWAQHYAEWFPHRRVVVVTGGAQARRKLLAQEADVYVINWESLRIHSRIGGYGSIKLTDAEREPKELNRPWQVVVADEAHRALKPKAKQTRALWAVGESARVRYPMTGTPIDGKPDSLWALLHFVAPDEWPSKTKFMDRYCLTTWNSFGGIDVIGLRPDRQEELFALLAPRMLRRPKSWLDLPEKMPPVTRYAEMTPKQAKMYKELKEEFVADVDGGTMVEFSPLTVAGRLSQMASASCTIEEDGSISLAAPSNKINELVDVLEEMGDEPAVVFMASAKLLELTAARLEAEGITVAKVVGGQSDLQRDGEIQAFKSGSARVIVLTFGAGAEGLTLTEASTIIFLQRSWSLIENLQADERVHRPGQRNIVTTINIVAPDTVEETQIDAIGDKNNRLQEIVRDANSLRSVL